jgi:hypothetical protein
VGSGPTRHRDLTAADTLLTWVSVCDGMLADEGLLARKPETWRRDLVVMRDQLREELAEHARLHAERI